MTNLRSSQETAFPELPDFKKGQIIKTLGRQITIPTWHEIQEYVERQRPYDSFWQTKVVGTMPQIRLLGEGEDSTINTNSFNQRGLVCFVPERYLGMAILSVSIVATRQNSVLAQPIEWIELNPPLDFIHIGERADTVYTQYTAIQSGRDSTTFLFQAQDIKPIDVVALWHNKEETIDGD